MNIIQAKRYGAFSNIVVGAAGIPNPNIVFVAGSYFLASNDGTTWFQWENDIGSEGVRDIIFNGDTYMLITTYHVYISTNFIDWIDTGAESLLPTDAAYFSCGYHDGEKWFVAYSDFDSDTRVYTGGLIYSTDNCSTWANTEFIGIEDLYLPLRIAYNGTSYRLVGGPVSYNADDDSYANNTVYASLDGITGWVGLGPYGFVPSNNSDSNNYRGRCFDVFAKEDGTWLYGGHTVIDDTQQAFIVQAGDTWSDGTVTSEPTAINVYPNFVYIWDVCYGNGTWVVCGQCISYGDVALLYSTDDGATWEVASGYDDAIAEWTTAWSRAVLFDGSYFYAVLHTWIYRSADGITWTKLFESTMGASVSCSRTAPTLYPPIYSSSYTGTVWATTATTVYVNMTAGADTTLNVDWGDGTEESISMTGDTVSFSKTYDDSKAEHTVVFSGTGNSTMTILSLASYVTSFQAGYNSALTHLHISQGNLGANLNVSNATALINLSCQYSNVTSLDVSANTALVDLYCSNNAELTSIDVSNHTALQGLYADDCGLTSINIVGATALSEINCRRNSLTDIDVSTNTALTLLAISDNNLTSLDVSTNTALLTLVASNNSLTSLDISSNTVLAGLYVDNCGLTSLSISNNPLMKGLSCTGNYLATSDINAHIIHLTTHTGNYGVYDSSGQTPSAPPTGDALTYVTSLEARGWTVTTD